MKTKLGLGLIVSVMTLNACGIKDEQVDQRLKNRVSQESAQQQITEREARDRLALEMELDLARRQRIYQAMKGAFEGRLDVRNDSFSIVTEFVPTVVPFDSRTRTRTPDEVNADLERLAFDLKVVIRDRTTKAILVNCAAHGVKMNLDEGSMSWLSESSSCSNIFSLFLFSGEKDRNHSDIEVVKSESRSMASRILSGAVPTASNLLLRMKPSGSNEVFIFTLNKAEL